MQNTNFWTWFSQGPLEKSIQCPSELSCPNTAAWMCTASPEQGYSLLAQCCEVSYPTLCLNGSKWWWQMFHQVVETIALAGVSGNISEVVRRAVITGRIFYRRGFCSARAVCLLARLWHLISSLDLPRQRGKNFTSVVQKLHRCQYVLSSPCSGSSSSISSYIWAL